MKLNVKFVERKEKHHLTLSIDSDICAEFIETFPMINLSKSIENSMKEELRMWKL